MSAKKFVINSAALSAAKILVTASQILVLPILARYLSPEEFGLVALCMTFVIFTTAITDAGLGQSLVRTAHFDQAVWSSAFWFIFALGIGMAAFLALLSPLLAWWFEQPQLTPLLLTLACVPLLQGVLSVPQAELQKRGDITTIALSETLSVFFGFATAILLAQHGAGVWALVWQQLVFWTLRVVLILPRSQFRPSLHFSLNALGEHLRFGKDIVAFGIVNFFLLQAHTLVIGKVLGAHSVGIYSMAARFANLPVDLVGGAIMYSMYPHLSRMRHTMVDLRETVLGLTRILAILIFPTMALLAASADSIFSLLLSPNWSQIGELFPIIAPAGALQGVSIVYATVLMATGHTRQRLRIALEMALLWIALLLVFVSFGLKAAAITYVVYVFGYFPRLATLFLRHIECPLQRYLGVLLLPAVIALLAFLVHRTIIAPLMPSSIHEVFVVLLELSLVWGLILILLRSPLRDSLRLMRRTLVQHAS